MNNGLMMLLPFLMGMNGNNKGGIPTETLLKMMSDGKGSVGQGNMNPLLLLLLGMMGGNGQSKQTQSEQPSEDTKTDTDPSKLFGADVAQMLKIFTAMKNNGN